MIEFFILRVCTGAHRRRSFVSDARNELIFSPNLDVDLQSRFVACAGNLRTSVCLIV